MRNLTSLILSMAATLAVAQAPQGLKYQAVVRDASGDPVVSGPVSFRLSVVKTSALGPAVYVETHATTTNALGLVDLVIGAGTPITATFAGIGWGSDAHFLKVEVDPAGGSTYVHLGTSQLQSVPYALYSKEAESITDNTLEGKGTKLDTLKIAQQMADSGDVLIWNGDTWAPIDVDIILNPPGGGDDNTLDKAYDEGGGGLGRFIIADSLPVEIRNTGANDALHVLDLAAAGTNTKRNVYLDYLGSNTAQHIKHTHDGNGLVIRNDSTTSGTAKNNVEVYAVANASGLPTSAGGRALLATTLNTKNEHPTVEGSTLGKWAGLLGQSGYNDWGTPFLNSAPPAGVIGFSGTTNVGSGGGGTDGPYDLPSFRRGRIGVAGLSYKNHGVWGMTNVENSWATATPDSIKAGVVGVESPHLPTISGNAARYDHFGVAGLNTTEGCGVIGIGRGHGVIGYGGPLDAATAAGVWGNTRTADWVATREGYSLYQDGPRNKGRVGVLGTSMDRVGLWGEGLVNVGVVATSGAQFGSGLIDTYTRIGLVAAATGGMAAKFMAEPDSSTTAALMTVILAETAKHAGYFETRSDTIMEAIVKIEHLAGGSALLIDAFRDDPAPEFLDKGHSIDVQHRADSSAAVKIHVEGSANGLFVKSLNDSAAIYVDDGDAIGIRSLTRAGRAGIMGISDKNHYESAGLVGVGDSHADSAAALEIKDGAIRITGPSTPGGRITLTAPIIPAGSMTTCGGGCPPPICTHDHATGFYFDVPVTNDLLDATRSMIFPTATAKVNFLGAGPGGIYIEYDAVTCHVLGIGEGTAVVRVTCFTSCPLDPFNTSLYYPDFLQLDYLIVNL